MRAASTGFLEIAEAYLSQWDEGLPEERLYDNCEVLTLHVLGPVGKPGDATLWMKRLLNPTGKARQGLL